MSDTIGYNFDPDSFRAHFEGSDIEDAVNSLTDEQLLEAQAYVHNDDRLYDLYSATMFDAALHVLPAETLGELL